jgi:hypothetical protein
LRQDWDYYREEVKEIDGLSNLQKSQYQESLDYMRKQIFDAKPSDYLPHHLLSTMIINQTKYSKLWLIEFTNSFRNYLTFDNCGIILGRIKNNNNFLDSLLEIYIGDAFSRGSFVIKCHTPIVNTKKKLKNPDFEVTDIKDRKYFIELKNMAISDQSKRVNEYMNIVEEGLCKLMQSFPDCNISGRFLIHPNTRTTNSILSKLPKILEGAMISGFSSFEEKRDGLTIFECAAVRKDSVSELIKWDQSRGLFSQPSDTIRSYEIFEDEIQRLNRAIIKKQNQLSTVFPNILIIRSNLLSSKVNKLTSLKHAIVQIKEIITDYQLINYFVIVDGYIAAYGENIKISECSDSVFVHQHNEQLHRSILITKNIDSKIKDNNMSIECLLKILENSRYLLV